MEIKENNIKTAAAILEILAKNKCTITDTGSILSFVESVIRNRATVPEADYFAEFTSRYFTSADSR